MLLYTNSYIYVICRKKEERGTGRQTDREREREKEREREGDGWMDVWSDSPMGLRYAMSRKVM